MKFSDELSDKMKSIVQEVDDQIAEKLAEVDQIALDNQAKVLDAFKDNEISEASLNGSTGYGNDDMGRTQLEKVYSQVFGTESALVRPQFVSGTHTLSTALFGNLRPGDKLLYVTGKPYDTMQEVIGIAGNGKGSLLDYGVDFSYVPLKQRKVDITEMQRRIEEFRPQVIAIQRSRGYDHRETLTTADIKEVIEKIREVDEKVIIFVDNCYGEFVELEEPTQVGADLMAGSLIKNPGGGIAKTGGYIVGKDEYVENAGYALTAPGVGREEGATIDRLAEMFQGFFMAPTVVSNAVKAAIFESAIFEKLDMSVSPKWNDKRSDIIQTINFKDRDKMVKFAQYIQKNSPVDSFSDPVPSPMAGYEDEIIMAAGTFVQGASIELSADGPLRQPYTLYLQGGLTYQHAKIAVIRACEEII